MCKCCDIINFWSNNLQKNDKMFARIVIYGWEDGEKKIKGNESFSYTSKTYDLKFCPQCGRKLEQCK